MLYSYHFPFSRKNTIPFTGPLCCPRNWKLTMATIGVGVAPSSAEPLFPAFAKLQGKDFEYYMRKYSIIVGRNSKKAIVDLDLGNRDGGGFAVSRRHARIYYDFPIKCFTLDVLGRNGCLIRNVLFKPGSPPIKLNSQDLIQIGEVRFYFLHPTRSFLETLEAAWKIVPPLMSQSVASPTSNDKKGEETEHDRKEAMAEVHISGSIVHEFSAREAKVSSSEQPGVVKSASQTVQSKLSQLTVAPLSPSTCERKVEDKGNDRKESLANGHSERGVSGGRTVKEINAREAEGSSGVLAYSDNVRMEHEKEHDVEHIVRIDHGKGIVSGLIVEELNASKADGSSGILAGAMGATKKTGASLPPLLVEVPLVFVNDVRKGEERLHDRGGSLSTGLGEGDVRGLMVKESDSAEVKRSSGLSSGTLKAAQEITVPLAAQLVLVPPTSLNNVKKRMGREGNLGIVHDENAASGLVVEFNASNNGVLSNKQSGTLEAAMQVEPHLPPEPVVDLLTASTGEEEDGDASGLIVEELNAEDSVGFPSEQSGTCRTAKHTVLSLPPQLIIVPLSVSNDERKGEEVEGNGEESEGTGQKSVAVTVTGFIVQDSDTKEAVGFSGEQFGVLEDASQITSPVLPQPMVTPLIALNDENNNVGKEGESEVSAGVGHGVGDVTGLIVENFNAGEAEDPSGGLSAREVASPLPCPLVVFPQTYSNGEGKCEEKDGDGKKSVGSGHSEAGVGGLNVVLNARDTDEGSSDMLSGGIKEFCLSGSKLEGKSRSTGEANNQEEIPDLHVFRVNLPGIDKEQINLELEDGKIWIQVSAEHATENMDKTDDMWHCVEDSSCKFLTRHLVLPKNVKMDQIKAVMEDGVLTVTVPKGDVETPAQFGVKSIEISD